jgi:hypothetical protein
MRQFSPPMDVPPASPIKPRRGPEDFGLARLLGYSVARLLGCSATRGAQKSALTLMLRLLSIDSGNGHRAISTDPMDGAGT